MALEIPGVVRNGSPIERILTGFDGLDDPIGLTDGTLVFSEPGARRVHRMNTTTNAVSVLVADSNESHGVTEDANGRLISAQAWDGSTSIGVMSTMSFSLKNTRCVFKTSSDAKMAAITEL